MRCSGCIYNKYLRLERAAHAASLVVVAEVPSPVGVRRGEVLDSRGGDVVRGTLKRVGLPHEEPEVYYTTAIKCAVPKKRGRQISKTAIQNCRSTLVQEVRATGAKVVIALGATAAKALLDDHSIKIREIQGLAKPIPELPEVQVITTAHPAVLLSSPGEYKLFLRAFEYASNLYHGEGEVLDPGETQYTVCRTKEDVDKAARFLSRYPLLGCDIETTELSPFWSEQQGRPGETLVVGIAYEKNRVIGFAKSAIPYLQTVLDLPSKFVWHGGKFDKLFMRVADGLDIRIDHDLMLAHYCLNETSGTHDLEQIAMRYLGADAYKDEANKWIRSKEGFESAPEEVQLRRVCVDADYTLQAFKKVYPLIKANADLSRLYHERLLPAAEAYPVMEMNGFKMCRKELTKLARHYEEESNRLLKEIQLATQYIWDPELYKAETGAKSASEHFKPTSPKQVSWLVFDRLKLKPRIRRGRSTSVDVLESIQNPPEIIKLILQYRSVVKESGTYVKGFEQRLDESDRVHSTFSLHVTATGRRSSSGPNIQNIPSRRRDIRRAFIPEEGWVLAEIDYSAAESRVLAIVSQDENYLNLFREGRDPHGELAARLYGENYTDNQRTRAKAVNFGVPYGRSAHTIAQEYDMPLQEAQELIDAWAARYPKVWDYLEDCARLALEGKALRSPMGRYKRPGLITPATLDSIQNEYKNYTIQSTVAEFTLLAVVRLTQLLDPQEAKIVNEVHDSLVLEILDDPEVIRRTCETAVRIMKSIPKEELGWELPFECDVEVGYNWADVQPLEEFLRRTQFQ